mgnify:CR=1 FL=1
MDTKNIIAAISLSAAVIILYSLFFAPTPQERKQIQSEKNITNESTDAPSLEQNEQVSKISRTEAVNEENRILFENDNIKGSISLTGSKIDDLEFKKFKKTLDGDDNVTLLNPSKVKNGYYVETGWATTNKNIDIPNSKSVWKIKGNQKLTPNSPIKLTWLNDQNIKFEKKISIDNQYLFSVEQTIINNSEKSYNFYPYGQIIRNEIPEITNFFILHEGPICIINSELVEKDYDDIQEEGYSENADKGFCGVTDKFWITSLIPQENRKFRADIDYKNNKFRTNFIETSPTEIGANETKSNKIKILLAAKEVRVIDEYAKKLNIEKLDLVIDWGYLYMLTRPMWFALDYFYKLLGNYGLAIIAVTLSIRIVLFPMAQMSFRSMSRMKLLQPEMARIKEVNKGDKTKIQQEMMALYKKEKVNPLSGCLPMIPMIFIFFALYKVLFVTLDGRHKPFYGYLVDLSSRDPTSIFNLFGLINWAPPEFLLVGALPLFFGLTMWLQQKLNPAPPDPVQAKIFMFFPIFLTVILAPFPSGLLLYWVTNNILQMIQQYIVMRKTKVKTA